MTKRLQDLFFSSVKNHGKREALREPGGASVTYTGLAAKVEEKMAWLAAHDIGAGCRVAVMMPKSIETVAVFLALLQSGAAYIPIDTGIPTERLQQILRNADPHAFIAHPDHFPSGIPCQQEELAAIEGEFSFTLLPAEKHTADLAFILYTSGSTGIPKGVCITHENARSFTDWALQQFPLSAEDRFSSIAPFHFDLSVFDLYVAFACGGTAVLFDEKTTRNARMLAQLLAQEKITVTYATPSQLSTLLHFGKIRLHDLSALRLVLFAGEIFPVQHLHALMDDWKTARFFNLYGPTETNVCTWFEIPRPYETDRTEPYPVGRVCPQLEGKLTREGELLIAGPNVTPGYWPADDSCPLNEKAFITIENRCYYRTGDRMDTTPEGLLVYAGRIDRMIKKRGYRIEPEEVERTLLRHPDVLEAAVLPATDAQGYTLLQAFLALKNAHTTQQAIREHCLAHLPGYMVPERITFLEALPKTPSGKIDFQKLKFD